MTPSYIHEKKIKTFKASPLTEFTELENDLLFDRICSGCNEGYMDKMI
jgi:hypothetical protein